MAVENEKTGENHPNAEEKLERILEESVDKGKKIAKIGRDLTEQGQTMADLAGATREVVHIVKAPPNVEFHISDWELTNHQAEVVLGQLGKINLPVFISASVTSASTSSDSFSYPTLHTIVPEEQRSHLATVLEAFEEVSGRAANTNEVAELMRSLALDEAPQGRKSSLELFETAHAAFGAPVAEGNPVVTSLIPMRESIRSAIDNLLRRRPKQEKTKNEWAKIVSIARELKRDELPASIGNSWAAQWTDALQSYLSPAKEEDISRNEWRKRLVRATLFLKGFLGGIDPSKFK